MDNLHLVAQFYRPPQREHLDRMVECIQRNADLEFVRGITLLDEDSGVDWENEKIRVVPTKRRASYADMLMVASDNEDVLYSHYALMNSDIILSADIRQLLPRITKPSTVAAITRRELDGSLRPQPKCSQDAWIFKARKPPGDLLDACFFRLGIAGCENLFAMSLYAHGYDIWNPCADCTITHNDPAPRMTFPQWVFGAYLWLPPCAIGDVEATAPRYEVKVVRKRFAIS